LASEREEQNEAIQSQAGQEFEEEEEEEENNTLWATIMEEGAFSELVGLPSAVVEDIYRDAQPELAAARRRGPRPKLGWLDHLLVIMMLYKLGTTVGGLAARINVKESTLADAITRIRPILNQTLHKRWWEARPRPKEFAQQGYRHVAALGDSTSLEVHRPGRFEEAKAYWDGKNRRAKREGRKSCKRNVVIASSASEPAPSSKNLKNETCFSSPQLWPLHSDGN